MSVSFNQDGQVGQGKPTQQQIRHMRRRAVLRVQYLVLAVLAFLFLFPILWSFINSIKMPSEALAVPPTYLPTRPVLDNYIELTTYGKIGVAQHVYNSTTVALMTVVGSVVLSTLGGYGFARFDFPAKNFLFIMVLSTLMIPFQSILICAVAPS